MHTTALWHWITQGNVNVGPLKVTFFSKRPSLPSKAGDAESALILLLNEADATALDFHQCTPLHFAASSGNANLCSLLLRFYPPAFSLQDERGNTPLHLSCCKGKSATALAMLHGIFASSIGFRVGTGCQNLEFFMHPHAIFLDVRNNEGNRAEDMATRSGHYELAEIVRYYKHKYHAGRDSTSERSLVPFHIRNFLLGSPGRRRVLFTYMLMVSFGWMYPYLWFRVRNTVVRLSPQQEIIFFLVNCILWVCFFKEYVTDPGYLPQNTIEYEGSMQEIFLESRELAAAPFPSAEDRDGKPQLCPLALGAFKRRARSLRQKAQRLCHTCGCVKPLRAKHCGQCNRCVDVMDHHCPVTNNCVGKNNRVWFLLTGIFVLISSSVTGYLAFMAWYWSPKTWFCDIFTWILLFSGWTSALNASVGTSSSSTRPPYLSYLGPSST
uniref:Palmitoyltransferase n=1 Tax=Schistocephalus solidus TaxID=70667 RepID=A0A0X3NPF2_SCHSO